MPSLLFCSYHFLLEPGSGAARSTRDLLVLLGRRGWQCQALCGPCLDRDFGKPLGPILATSQLTAHVRQCQWAGHRFGVLHVGGLPYPVLAYEPSGHHMPPARHEGEPFLGLLERCLQRSRPDVVLTYGGTWLGRQTAQIARQHHRPVVFAIHNFSYSMPDLFAGVDAVLTPSQFTSQYYRNALGISSTAIPCPLDWEALRCPSIEPRYVSFVNPSPNKGVFWFARIAHEVNRIRPDIPFLVVDGRGSTDWLSRSGLDLRQVRRMATTSDMRECYRQTRVVLMPSLWNETFGRIAAEAMINGIPVLASRRGALSETLAQAGLLFDIPARYTPDSLAVPSDKEVQPWVQAIIRLFGDSDYYESEHHKALEAAQAWQEQIIAQRHEDFLMQAMASARIRQQSTQPAPAPPVVQPQVRFVSVTDPRPPASVLDAMLSPPI